MNTIIGVGLGLIGGSFLLSLQRFWPDAQYLGIDNSKKHLQQAVDVGIIEDEAKITDFAQADIVIVSLPVDVAPKEIDKILNQVGKKTLVIDTGSTKTKLCNHLQNHSNRKQFLATHPIAGTEFSGPKAAFSTLFDGKTIIICEIEKTDPLLVSNFLTLVDKTNMRLRYMDPIEHNKHIAYVSHLSHISSFMLGKTVIEKEKNECNIFDLAGSGFASTVRLAKSNPSTWTPIFKQNKRFVLEALSEYIHNLQEFKEALKTNNYPKIYADMDNTNAIKSILKGISTT